MRRFGFIANTLAITADSTATCVHFLTSRYFISILFYVKKARLSIRKKGTEIRNK